MTKAPTPTAIHKKGKTQKQNTKEKNDRHECRDVAHVRQLGKVKAPVVWQL